MPVADTEEKPEAEGAPNPEDNPGVAFDDEWPWTVLVEESL